MIRHALTRNRDGGASGTLGALLDMLAKGSAGWRPASRTFIKPKEVGHAQ